MDIQKKSEELNEALKEVTKQVQEAQDFLTQKTTERERLIGALAILNDIENPQTEEPVKQAKK